MLLGNVLDIGTPSDGTVSNAKLGTDVISGETDIGADIADADLILLDDGAGGTLRKSAMSRIATYIGTNTPAWSASLSADTSIADNTVTKIPCNTEYLDTDSAYDNSTNYRFTVPSGKGGNYFVHASSRCASASDFDSFYLYIKKNGSEWLFNGIRNEYRETTEINNVIPLVATDYLEAFVYQGSGGSVNLSGSSDKPFATNFSGFKII
jgi:hypothetical protein